MRAPFEFAPVFHKNCSQSELSIFPVHTINLSYCVECVQFCQTLATELPNPDRHGYFNLNA